MTCSSEGCSFEAAWEPVVNLWPAGHDKLKVTPAQLSMVGIALCDLHRSECRITDLLDDDTWNQIKVGMFDAGLPQPERETAFLTYCSPHTKKGRRL